MNNSATTTKPNTNENEYTSKTLSILLNSEI